MIANGTHAFRTMGKLYAAIPQVATGGIGNKAWWKHRIWVYNTIMTNFLKAALQFPLVEIQGDWFCLRFLW